MSNNINNLVDNYKLILKESLSLNEVKTAKLERLLGKIMRDPTKEPPSESEVKRLASLYKQAEYRRAVVGSRTQQQMLNEPESEYKSELSKTIGRLALNPYSTGEAAQYVAQARRGMGETGARIERRIRDLLKNPDFSGIERAVLKNELEAMGKKYRTRRSTGGRG